MRVTPLSLLVVSAMALTTSFTQAQQVQPEEFTLDNGMTFLLLPRYEDPHTISAGWVAKVGSVNERPGITGISHFFEHMMFKGTTTIGVDDAERDQMLMEEQHRVRRAINGLVWGEQYERYRRGEIDDPWDPANDTPRLRELRAELRRLMETHREIIVKNEFDQIYTKNGASGMNAFTSNDVTFYFITVPSNKFELWAWMESDRLSDSTFREFYAERDVVHEERRMRLDSTPTGELSEQFDAMFWQSSPYSWSVIGWPSDLNSYSREDFDDYFGIYYRPNNLVGVIVGDFDPAEVKSTIRAYFGQLERGAVDPPPVVTYEVKQLAEKRMIGSCDCQPQVEVRYHTVAFDHADEAALEMLAEILNGRTGRLYKSMIEGASIASSAGAMQNSLKYDGYFGFSAEVKGDATPEDLEQAWYAEVARLRDELVPDQELQKVKNQVAADSYRRLQSNQALLFQLGMSEAMGDWSYINEHPRRMAKVTPADIQRVARTYFVPENRNVGLFTRREQPASEEMEGPVAPDPFAGLSPQERGPLEATLARLMAQDDPSDLRRMLPMLKMAATQAPEHARPAMEHITRMIEDRIAELDAKNP